MNDHRTPLRHTRESGNRTAKAVRIVALLDAHTVGGTDAETVAALPEDSWSHVASLTGGRPISPATRAEVIAQLEARNARRIMPAMDVFAGLGAA